MLGLRGTLLLASLSPLALASSARADLAPVRLSGALVSVASDAAQPPVVPACIVLGAGVEGDFATAGCQPWSRLLPAASGTAGHASSTLPLVSASQSDNVVELPAPPSGGALTLTGLMTLGGLQLGRCARSLKLGSAPQQFYEATHPDGVDYSANLDLDVSALPASAFVVLSEHQSVVHHVPRDFFVPRLLPQTVLTLTAPRCPPAR